MRTAFGLRAHSGWAVAITIGAARSELVLVDRRRIELVNSSDIAWAKQPYHAAENLPLKEAEKLISRAVNSAFKIAGREVGKLVSQLTDMGHEVAGCSVLMPAPMTNWSVKQILAVHPRMHKAEGVLFPGALAVAAVKNGLNLIEIPAKRLDEHAADVFGLRLTDTLDSIAAIGKTAGPPWGKDQKNAALAAAIALQRET